MSQDELASMLGWKHTRISDIERGKNALTTTTISRIAAAMGMTDDEFYSLGSRLSQEQGQ